MLAFRISEPSVVTVPHTSCVSRFAILLPTGCQHSPYDENPRGYWVCRMGPSWPSPVVGLHHRVRLIVAALTTWNNYDYKSVMVLIVPRAIGASDTARLVKFAALGTNVGANPTDF